MPFLVIHSNAEPTSPSIFLEEASRMIAQELRKPINYVIVSLDYNPQMAFAGTCHSKGALVEMKSVGFGDKKDLAMKLTDFLVSHLDVQKDLVNIEFVDMPASGLSIGGNLLG